MNSVNGLRNIYGSNKHITNNNQNSEKVNLSTN